MQVLAMLKLFGVTTLVTTMVCGAAAGAEETWIPLSSTVQGHYERRAGSFRFTTTIHKQEAALIELRTLGTAARPSALEFAYVLLSHCEKGRGKLVATDLNGQFLYENDFDFEGADAASVIGQAICTLGTRP
jgi:hypothetical protein